MTGCKGFNRILPTKINPPHYGKNYLFRKDLLHKMYKITRHRLTLVCAGAGYGKSLSVSAALSGLDLPVAWVSLEDGDKDPYLFCDYLLAALETVLPGKLTYTRRELDTPHSPKPWRLVVGALIQELYSADSDRKGLLLVMDDYHLVAGESEIDWVVNFLLVHAPEWLHLVLITRHDINLPCFCRLRARGELLEIGRDELAMGKEEIAELFATVYGMEISTREADLIWRRTEGWPIALQLLFQRMAKTPDREWESLPKELEPLFQYLAQEVLARQPETIRMAVMQMSVLDDFDEKTCNAVLGNMLPVDFLNQIKKRGLFLISLGGGYYRFHHLFQEFLREQLRREDYLCWQLNQRAAEYYYKEGQVEKALIYYMQSKTWQHAADLLEELAPTMLENGRGKTLEGILERLPEKYIRLNPMLLVAAGDAARLSSNFEKAEKLYGEALALAGKIGLWRVECAANRGLALIYLDTIQPGPAEKYLKRALKALKNGEMEEKARLVQLMAENKINQGKPEHARRYQRLACEMLHMASRGDPDARLLLRTGRLASAQKLLETKAGREEKRQRSPRSHRETPLLLSLLYSFQGQADKALATAREGIAVGEYLESPFVVAVGQMRLGHAWLLQQPSRLDAAEEAYQTALDISDRVGVRRGRAEALMGLCLVYAHGGDLDPALRHGREGVAVAEQVHDFWFAAILRLSMGVAAAVCKQQDLAGEFLAAAGDGFRRCGDSHGLALCCWWRAYLAHRSGRRKEFLPAVRELLNLCQIHGYDFLLTRRTLLGARDARASVPLLIEARREEIRSDYVQWLLSELGLSETGVHPGYTLRVQALGRFRVWRGEKEITSQQWQREKAKRLFQLLLTNRRQLVHKEQLMETLWPERDGETADRDFKVALNALMKALEPGRPPRSNSAFIIRESCSYGLNLASGYWLDADEFESLVEMGYKVLARSEEQAMNFFKRALEIYQGDFLQEIVYDEWCAGERERLAVLYLRAAETLAGLLARRGDYAGAVQITDRILARDNCWEEAYRLKMQCYSRLGNKSMVARVFVRCQENLEKELGISPSLETVKLYQALSGRKRQIN